jgi:diadenosine tetraphosphate (Ap4A) HIT family hydrolase
MPNAHDPIACLLCGMEDAGGDRVVFRDERWAAEIIPGYDVPGWVVLRVRRHAERLGGLDEQELATFGARARDISAAVGEATGAATTYLMVFGENHRHFHALIAARGDDVPADRRSGDILKLRLERADPAAAVALVPTMRDAYNRATSAQRADGEVATITPSH